ncbi:MAG TPA: TetR/AcrR family transcriptional regulator [Candidatus Limnocylindrales bacterium]
MTEVREPARTARRDVTRERVLDAAREVFAEKGVFGGSVEEICERAGFTRGAFYSNFADKDDVLRALVEREQGRLLTHLDASLEAVDGEIAAAPDLESVLHSIVDRILRSVPVDRQLMLMTSELEIHAIRRPDLPRDMLDVNARFRGRIGAYISAAMERHGRELIVPATDVTDTLFAVVERSYRRALLGGEGGDPDGLASSVLPGILLAFSRLVG